METLVEDGIYEQLEVAGQELRGLSASGARFFDCQWSTSVIDEGNLESSSWRGGGLNGVRLVGTQLARSQWFDVTLENCALAGVELFGAQLRQVVIRGGMLQGVNLRQTRLQDVVFEDCVLRDVDLGAAVLERVRFPGCRIEQVDLTAVRAHQVDLRGARITIARGTDRLRGMVIDHVQLMELAPMLAAAIGLEVRATEI